VGRFSSEDPLGLRGALPSLFAYALNRPSAVFDPMGMTAVPARPHRPEPPTPICHNCDPHTPDLENAGVNICRLVNTGGSGCRETVKKYGMLNCFTDKCRLPLDFVCQPENCGEKTCAGPCMSWPGFDPTQHIYMQPRAFLMVCWPLQKTVAHEMAHMCGVGMDRQFKENRLMADNIGEACGGGQ
jgi:hypothetical protein